MSRPSSDDPRLGQTLGHYRILERLGAGGMGVVYRAHDERLDRDVAVKVLPSGSLADESARRRFKQEALALSSINHPNIAIIHDFDADDGVDILVMEFIPGTTLDQLIAPAGVGEHETRRLGVQLADGLIALHQHGIVHRDLKPGNLRVTPDGRLKILDFGLARLLQSESRDVTGAANMDLAGTLPYIAPEQITGASLDARVDVYAAGAVLFELATGRQMFPELRGSELLGAIVHRSPPNPRTLNPQLSEALEGAILRALAKKPADRIGSASELKLVLQEPASGDLARAIGIATAASARRASRSWRVAALLIGALTIGVVGASFVARRSDGITVNSSGRTTIAVMPFHTQAVSESIRFLGIGIPDAIIMRLAGVPQLAPRPTSAVLRYENQTVDPREAGIALASDYVLTGMLQQAGDRLRVSVQLVRADDGRPTWGHHYDVARSDLLALQDQIAQAVADALKIQMTAAERERAFRRYTDNAPAYELYLRGRSEIARDTLQGFRNAIASFERALALDPGYALARGGIAMASALIRLRYAPPSEAADWTARAEREARAGMQQDRDLAEAHEALAVVAYAIEVDWERVLEESRLALALNPNLDLPHFLRARAFYHLGLFDLVEGEVQAGIAANPTNRFDPLHIGAQAALLAGRFQHAVSLGESYSRLRGDRRADYLIAQGYYFTGRAAEAEKMLRQSSGVTPTDRRQQAILASQLAARGSTEDARLLVTRLIDAGALDHHMAYSVGVAYAHLGELAQARRWLAEAARTGLPCYPWYARDPLLAPLRDDPEFRRFLDALKESWQAVAARYGSSAASDAG